MAYNRINWMKQANYIIGIYREVKQADIPDTRIVAKVFPQHGIFISYRQWMNIKGMRPSQYKQRQPSLFDQLAS